jgi:hypothetical protein
MIWRAVLRRVVLPLVAFAPLVGCDGGDGLPRQAISGMVTFGGQPLADGTIQFQPAVSQGGPAVQAGALIADGRYQIGRDEGLVPGTYKVMIFSHGGRGAPGDEAASPGAQTGPPPERIPSRYNLNTTLTAEVKPDQGNGFNFDLKK